MDLRELTLEDALAQICILAEYAEEQLAGDPLELELEQVKNAATGWLGEMLARKRISFLRDSMQAKPPARKPKPAKVSIPPAEDDITEAVEEPAPDAPPPIGQIKDGGRFMALAKAGWSKAKIAEDMHVDTRVVEEYAKVMRIPLTGRRRSTRKMLENLAGDPELM